MTGSLASRLEEISKQATIVGDELDDQDALDVPDGLVDEIYTIGERARRAKHALRDLDIEQLRGEP